MRKERKHYTAEEKEAILRHHLLDKVPVSDLCEELGRPAGGVLPLAKRVLGEWKILNYARTTQTQTGLRVAAYLDRRRYPCGLKPTPDQIANADCCPRNSARTELHYQVPTVNLFLRNP
jgi:hypothetical protein